MSAWAKRKAAVQAEADVLERTEQDAVVAEQHAALAEKTDEEALAELDLPNPDDMQAGDDFSAFMKSTVPAAFRNRALRKLWTSDPVLANVDMLVDYGEDFTGKNDVGKIVKTIYRVGKGMLPDKEEEIEPEAEMLDQQIEDVANEAGLADEADAPAFEDAEVFVAPTLSETPEIEAEDQPLAPRRRMRFSFADGTSPAITEMETL
ncbi:MAG: DUF3306 domain-containing protein [Marinosulfonomonas sp.]|nr:DUF3306 domain-containing protein [Marinosulfonomonas sp.]